MTNGVLNRGEGRSVWVTGDRYTVKSSGEETGGAFALIEVLVPPQGGPPPHIHRREDEAFYVLEGTVEFHAGDRSFTAAPGAWVTLARGGLHTFRNVGETAARMLIVVTPAGLERFFLEAGRPAEAGDVGAAIPTHEDIDRLLELAPRYGLEIRVPQA